MTGLSPGDPSILAEFTLAFRQQIVGLDTLQGQHDVSTHQFSPPQRGHSCIIHIYFHNESPLQHLTDRGVHTGMIYYGEQRQHPVVNILGFSDGFLVSLQINPPPFRHMLFQTSQEKKSMKKIQLRSLRPGRTCQRFPPCLMCGPLDPQCHSPSPAGSAFQC